jgi:hypothetical protein
MDGGIVMKIKVSKVFANYINKCAKEMGFKAEAYVETMSENQYRFCVGNVFDAMDNGDCDMDDEGRDVFKVIAISYPCDYYAPTTYLTTEQLNKEWRRRNGKTEQDLREMIRELCEI